MGGWLIENFILSFKLKGLLSGASVNLRCALGLIQTADDCFSHKIMQALVRFKLLTRS